MHVTADLLMSIGNPSFAFSPDATVSNEKTQKRATGWDQSAHNPALRIDSLATLEPPLKWRVDGVTQLGTQYFVVPITGTADFPPIRVDAFLPVQRDIPSHLHGPLQSSLSTILRDSRVMHTGIARHICHALTWHQDRNPSLRSETLRGLPFGSSIEFETIGANVADMQPVIVSNHQLERCLLSSQDLQKLWMAEQTFPDLPPPISVYDLALERQLHDSISLVSSVSQQQSVYDAQKGHRYELFIFKSTRTSPKYLYHELKTLLVIPPHPNIMPRPLNLVTTRSKFGSREAVCGFLLPYYSGNSLKHTLPLLPSLVPSNQNRRSVQLEWALQLTSALAHIYACGLFYTDLRPDNVLLTSPDPLTATIILADFESRGNWNAWCSSRVLFPAYLEHICSSLPTSHGKKAFFTEKLASLSIPRLTSSSAAPLHEERYSNPSQGYYMTWLSMTDAERESATVHSLGKMIWCILSSCGNLRASIWSELPVEPRADFPSWRYIPEASLQDLIRRCTWDAAEWQDSVPEFVRRWGTRLMARRTDDFMEGGGIGEVLEQEEYDDDPGQIEGIARTWWKWELERMEEWLAAREGGKLDVKESKVPLLKEVHKELEEAKRDLTAKDVTVV